MRDQDVHHMRERGRIRTIFCIITTEKVRSGFLVFPKRYLHLLEKVDSITICFNFCYEILSQVKTITEIMIKIYQQHCRPSVSYFVLFSLVNSNVHAKNKRKNLILKG